MAPRPGDKRPKLSAAKGQGSLLTVQMHAKVIDNLRSGVSLDAAARAADLAPRTLHEWLMVARRVQAEQTRRKRTDYERACVALLQDAERVYEEVHVLLAGRIVSASADDWRAASWMLSRRHPEAWAQTEKVEVSGPGGGPIEVEHVRRRAVEYLEGVVEEPSGNGQRALG